MEYKFGDMVEVEGSEYPYVVLNCINDNGIYIVAPNGACLYLPQDRIIGLWKDRRQKFKYSNQYKNMSVHGSSIYSMLEKIDPEVKECFLKIPNNAKFKITIEEL